jgi:flagellar protein FlaG
MISKVSEVQSVSNVQTSSSPAVPTPSQTVQTVQAVQPVQSVSPDLRLVIEEDEASGAFVYKTLDRETGEVVLQLPYEELLELRRDPAYDPGTVVSTKA